MRSICDAWIMACRIGLIFRGYCVRLSQQFCKSAESTKRRELISYSFMRNAYGALIGGGETAKLHLALSKLQVRPSSPNGMELIGK